MISAQAGMTALTRAPIGVIRAVPETWRMYRAIVEELAAVARAEGVRLDDGAVDAIMKGAEGLAPEALSSLYHDLVQGLPQGRSRLASRLARSGATRCATARAERLTAAFRAMVAPTGSAHGASHPAAWP
jgi:2-dehydropantoate 2-reductase